MIAAIAFEPVFFAAFLAERPQDPCAIAVRRDPELAALVREIKAVEGDQVATRQCCSGSSSSAALA